MRTIKTTTGVTIDARLLELDVDGKEVAVVRDTGIDIPPDQTACCLVRFNPVPGARWRFFRLDLTVGDLNGRHLGLRLAPAPVNGRLTLNGRPQRAFLLFEAGAAGGTGLARLRSAPSDTVAALAAAALLINAAIAVLMHLVPTAYDPQRA